MIYTSYFAYDRRIPTDVKRVSIARRSPAWWTGERWLELAPSLSLLMRYRNRIIDQTEYCRIYIDQLNKLGVFNLAMELSKYCSIDRDLVLYCYERPDSFCHRHLLADYMSYHTGIRILEYSNVHQS